MAESFSKIDFKKSLEREAVFDRASVNTENRTVALSFSSDEPYERYFGWEILDHAPKSVRLDRLRKAGALLFNHNRDNHIGGIESVSLDGNKGRAIVRFSRSKLGDEKFQDVQDGILKCVSVGYNIYNASQEGVRDGIPVIRVIDWEPTEISMCTIPADVTVGVGRQAEESETSISSNKGFSVETKTEVAPAAVAAPAVETRDTGKATEARIKEIFEAAALWKRQTGSDLNDLAREYAFTGKSVTEFNQKALEGVKPAPAIQAPATVGLNSKDQKRYSMLGAIRAIADGKPLDGLERECNDELTRKLGRQPAGFFVPDEVLLGHRHLGQGKRTLTAGVAADGGYTVPQELLTSEFVELLRNQTKVVQLGARVIGGLQGDISIPRQLTGATAYWVSETGSITQSGATFGQIVGKPKRIGTSVPYSKQFLAQTSLGAENFVRDDSLQAIAVDLDRVAIRGAGGAEPLGILNLAAGDRSTSVTFGAAATWAKYVEFWTNVATNNALLGNPAYLTTPASYAKGMTIPRFSNTGVPIIDNGKIGVYGAEWSNQFPSSGTLNQVIFGDFSQVIFLEWAGYDVVVDPYSGKKEGTVEVTIQRLMDMVIRRAKSFAISADSGAQ
jgi:HK97 family phage major capsid protein